MKNLLTFLALLALASARAAERPNIVFIMADDLGYGDLGCYGAKDFQTPHIDRLGREGTRFTSFYVAQAVCTASRAAQRTLVVFTSDNGPLLSYGEHAGSAGPLREGKLTAFGGGVNVPCVMRWPGRVPAGRVTEELVTTMDLYASFARLAGAPLPATKIDGADLTPLLLGEKGAKGRDTFWLYSGEELHAVRLGDWKLHLPHEYLAAAAAPGRGGKPSNWENVKPQAIKVSGIRGTASRHGYRVKKIGLALYDLRHDPGETRDAASVHPEIVARLQAEVAKARADLGDSLTGVPATHARPAGDVGGTNQQARP